jgi:ATP synthase protein I
VYTTQIGLLLALLFLLRDADFLNGRAFGAGVLVAAVAWLAGQTRAGLTLKTPYVEPEPSATPSAAPSTPGGTP